MVKDPKTGDLVPDTKGLGIPIGEYYRDAEDSKKKLKIYNHLQMTVKVHKPTGGGDKRVVGFEVHPMSRHTDDKATHNCHHSAKYEDFFLTAGEEFIWSYCIRTQVSFLSVFLLGKLTQFNVVD